MVSWNTSQETDKTDKLLATWETLIFANDFFSYKSRNTLAQIPKRWYVSPQSPLSHIYLIPNDVLLSEGVWSTRGLPSWELDAGGGADRELPLRGGHDLYGVLRGVVQAQW